MRLLSNILLLTAGVLSMTYPLSPSGHVKGEVWYRPFFEAQNEFRNVSLPNCEITFRSNAFQKSIASDDDGHYEADLPTGIYNATTGCAVGPNSPEYHPATRSEFEVKPNSSSLINLMALVKRIKPPSGGKVDQPEYRKDDLDKEFLEVKTAARQSRRILVRYTGRLSSRELAEYQGKRDYRQDAPVSVTYEALAIYADTITIEKPALHVRAVGHVVVEDGTERHQCAEATIEFDAADPIATLKILGQSAGR